MKGWRLFGMGVAMIAIGAAGLKTVDASEMAPLIADELRQTMGQFSQLVMLSGLAESVVIQGGKVASTVVNKRVKTGPLRQPGERSVWPRTVR